MAGLSTSRNLGKIAARDHCSAAVRRQEAARRSKEALLAEQNFLLDKLPTEGTSAAETERMLQSQVAQMYCAHASHMSPHFQTCWTAGKQSLHDMFPEGFFSSQSGYSCSCFTPPTQRLLQCHPWVRWQQSLRLVAGMMVKLNVATMDRIEDSSLFVCRRADDSNNSLPSQCGFFVSPTGIICAWIAQQCQERNEGHCLYQARSRSRLSP